MCSGTEVSGEGFVCPVIFVLRVLDPVGSAGVAGAAPSVACPGILLPWMLRG
ncbi:hypothetical protein IWQ49_006690 [Labrenzia sp. EL_126]|nr:hypothetical protein [Labrenzia sp. EL_126]